MQSEAGNVAHPVACAAALAVQQVIRRDRLLDNVQRQGARLAAALGQRLGDHDHVGDIRGRGLFQGVELVAERASGRPFEPAARLANRIKQAAMERGLCVYPGSGTIDGHRGDHILIAPPFIADEATIDEIVNRLGGAIDAAVAEARDRS